MCKIIFKKLKGEKIDLLGYFVLVSKLIHYFTHLLYSANHFNLLTYETDTLIIFVLCISIAGLFNVLMDHSDYGGKPKIIFDKYGFAALLPSRCVGVVILCNMLPPRRAEALSDAFV